MSQNPSTPISNGLALLLAADAAFARGAGDRNRIKAMDDVLSAAITCKARFDVNDGARIEKAPIAIRTCVGVFRPLDPRWYHKAAIAGGTYARMWEKHHGFKPFVAPEAWRGENPRESPLLRQRLVPGVAIVLEDDAPDDALQTHAGGAVWWCTNLDVARDRIMLCRYAGEGLRQPWMYFDREQRRPVRRMTIIRAQWDELMRTLVVSNKAAAAA